MCGRVILTLSAKMIEQILNGSLDINKLNIDDYMPRYNIGPGQNVLSIIEHKGHHRAGYMNWQFIPTYAKDETSGYKFFNARSETIHEKNSFKDAFLNRRCLVPVNGFYEWHRGDEKTPYLFYHHDQLFYLGGIWNPYMTKHGQKAYGLSLITTDANTIMQPIHHRLPVIIKPEDAKSWLHEETHLLRLQELMNPIESAFLQYHQVSNYVNAIRNEGPKCIERVG